MRYFLTAAALKLASTNTLTRGAYRVATGLRQGPRKAEIEEALWCLDGLPDRSLCILELGTGWVHGLSVFCALLRQDELYGFDVEDLRKWRSFQATVPIIAEKVMAQPLDPATRERARRKSEALSEARDFEEAYRIMRMQYCCSPTGRLDYPDAMFDRIMSVDVLEHVDADMFPSATREWRRMLKPGGQFVAQVGLDDHLAFYQGRAGSKRYLRYGERTWRVMLGNTVQYINRLTASEIIAHLREAGFVIDLVETDSRGDTSPEQVHPDYAWQSEADIRTVRLFVRAHVP